MKRFFKAFVLLGTIFLASCSKPNPWTMTNTASLPETSSAPKITSITDLGAYEIPCCGTIDKPARVDGFAVVGETLLIRGKAFGRGPSVSIGGVPTEVLARTEDGAILVRVPPKSRAGTVEVVVSNEYGSSTAKLKVFRFAAAVVPGAGKVNVLDGTTFSQKGEIPVDPDGARVVFHPSRPFLYVYTGGAAPSLKTVDLSGKGTPVVVDTQKVPAGRLFTMEIPRKGNFLVIAVEKGYRIYSLERPDHPLAQPFVDWPKGVDVGKITDIALAPSGKVLMVLQQPGVLRSVDIQTWDIPVPAMDLGPVERDLQVPLARSVAFLDTGSTVLWVALGDTPESLKVGYHPARIAVFGYTDPPDRTKAPTLQRLGTYTLPMERYTPSVMAPATRGLDKAEDARMGRGSFFLYVGALHSEFMTIGTNPLTTPSGLQQGAETIARAGAEGFRLVRFDEVANSGAMYSSSRIAGAMTVSFDGRSMLAVECEPVADPKKPDVTVTCGYSYGSPKGRRTFVKGNSFPKERFVPPFRFGSVDIQD